MSCFRRRRYYFVVVWSYCYPSTRNRPRQAHHEEDTPLSLLMRIGPPERFFRYTNESVQTDNPLTSSQRKFSRCPDVPSSCDIPRQPKGQKLKTQDISNTACTSICHGSCYRSHLQRCPELMPARARPPTARTATPPPVAPVRSPGGRAAASRKRSRPLPDKQCHRDGGAETETKHVQARGGKYEQDNTAVVSKS